MVFHQSNLDFEEISGMVPDLLHDFLAKGETIKSASGRVIYEYTNILNRDPEFLVILYIEILNYDGVLKEVELANVYLRYIADHTVELKKYFELFDKENSKKLEKRLQFILIHLQRKDLKFISYEGLVHNDELKIIKYTGKENQYNIKYIINTYLDR